MKRKQRKSLPWRRFGNVILIIIKFCELLLRSSPRIINRLRSYIKHSKECFLLFPNTSKVVKKTRLCLVFPTYFSVFGNRRKHSSLCLIYNFNHPISLTVIIVVFFITLRQLFCQWPASNLSNSSTIALLLKSYSVDSLTFSSEIVSSEGTFSLEQMYSTYKPAPKKEHTLSSKSKEKRRRRRRRRRKLNNLWIEEDWHEKWKFAFINWID